MAATAELLTRLKALYPSSGSAIGVAAYAEKPWYLIAAVSFASSNRPEEVPIVLEYVLKDLDELNGKGGDGVYDDARKRVVLRMREAIFKGGLICGYSRAISALLALYDGTPEELRQHSLIRFDFLLINTAQGSNLFIFLSSDIPDDTVKVIGERGEQLYRSMYGDTADGVQTLLDKIHPDMGFFSNTIGYGLVYNHLNVVNQLHTSYSIVAALIAMDTPRQINWHLANCRRGGASMEEVKAVRDICITVSEKCGVVWRDGVPEVKED